MLRTGHELPSKLQTGNANMTDQIIATKDVSCEEVLPGREKRHWSQDETIAWWVKQCDEEKRLKEAYRAVYDDMQNSAFKKAFFHLPDEPRYAALMVVEQALRLAYCCVLGGEKAPAFVSTHQRKFCEAFVRAIGTHQMLRKEEKRREYPAIEAWGILWRSKNRLDGDREELLGEVTAPHGDGHDVIKPAGYAQTALSFKTRKDAEGFIKDRFGYIKTRPDLRAEPHGWKMPKPVKIKICVERAS